VRSRQQGPPRHTLTTHGRYTTAATAAESAAAAAASVDWWL